MYYNYIGTWYQGIHVIYICCSVYALLVYMHVHQLISVHMCSVHACTPKVHIHCNIYTLVPNIVHKLHIHRCTCMYTNLSVYMHVH